MGAMQQINYHLADAAALIDRCDDVIANAYFDQAAGEPIPPPPRLDEAQKLWEEAWELIGKARGILKPLVQDETLGLDADNRE